MNLKNNRGSITIFIIVSCLLFIITAVGIATYIQNKVNNSEAQYKQIKEIYEKDIGNEEFIYNNLENKDIRTKNDTFVKFDKKDIYVLPTGKDTVTISQRVYIENNKKEIENIEYIWLNQKPIDITSITEGWNALDSKETIFNIKNENIEEGNYYLYIKINENEYFYSKKENTDEIKPIEVKKATITIEGTVVKFGNGLNYNYKIGKSNISLEEAKNNIQTVNNITEEDDGTKISTITEEVYIYIEATDAYGNKVYQNK